MFGGFKKYGPKNWAKIVRTYKDVYQSSLVTGELQTVPLALPKPKTLLAQSTWKLIWILKKDVNGENNWVLESFLNKFW